VTVSAAVFYTANLVIVSGYLFAALTITRRLAVAKDLSWRAWFAGLSFFLFCGLTHTELAYHAYIGAQIIHPDGSVDWHMQLIHVPQAVSIWGFLLSVRGVGPQPTSGPLLGLRLWWWGLGQPRSRLFRRSSREEVPLEGAADGGIERGG
jgi:hypothetical protein